MTEDDALLQRIEDALMRLEAVRPESADAAQRLAALETAVAASVADLDVLLATA